MLVSASPGQWVPKRRLGDKKPVCRGGSLILCLVTLVPFYSNYSISVQPTFFGSSSIKTPEVQWAFLLPFIAFPQQQRATVFDETPEGVSSLSLLLLLSPGLSTWLEEAFTVQAEPQAPLSLLLYLPHNPTTQQGHKCLTLLAFSS